MATFYITTAIDYVNGEPHLGHAYEKICADVIARWHRLKGDEVWFLTGTDENAQKNVQAAAAAGMGTKEFVDQMTSKFLKLAKLLNISNDDFIRTTEERHKKSAKEIFSRLVKNRDIYKGTYEGLYCEGCEAFCTERELVKGRCAEHEISPKHVKEENYFFKLSAYQKKLQDHFRENPSFVQPMGRRNEIVERLKEPLKDISVSRHNVSWGIDFPGDKNHKIYVWVEALANYLTALGFPEGLYKKFWPANLHVIGTGINWFHSVIWPALLMSADIALPKHIFVHGYITNEGRKMSKSVGNVIDPFTLLERFGADQVRYFLIRDIPLGEDRDFSEGALKSRINGELVSDLGNLVSRVLTLLEKATSPLEGTPVLEKDINLAAIEEYMEKRELHHALEGIFRFVRVCNKYINDTEPWKKEGEELSEILYNLLEGLRIIAILIQPFMPETAEKINQQLGVKQGTLKDCSFKKWTGNPKKGKHIFQRIM